MKKMFLMAAFILIGMLSASAQQQTGELFICESYFNSVDDPGEPIKCHDSFGYDWNAGIILWTIDGQTSKFVMKKSTLEEGDEDGEYFKSVEASLNGSGDTKLFTITKLDSDGTYFIDIDDELSYQVAQHKTNVKF
ncbi:MAG: hypothetical protein RR382_07620 [Tannerellaceae bacterium]